ncbi:hypothetical protein AGOR_G00025630 [Albula goreensis]|uniref:Uncharacterized protein n=1 Tax=Albula goreensis TaxID=1534307 RepID=A0A8T3E901_9TELE|nr:hypothetical protein AGOR_G00025630 [Albula goreensis]
MGTKQTKGAGPEPGPSPQHKRTPTKQRGDIFASFMLKSGDRFGRGGPPPPYQRRIGMIQEMMVMAKEGKQNEATELLKTLRQVSDIRYEDECVPAHRPKQCREEQSDSCQGTSKCTTGEFGKANVTAGKLYS